MMKYGGTKEQSNYDVVVICLSVCVDTLGTETMVVGGTLVGVVV